MALIERKRSTAKGPETPFPEKEEPKAKPAEELKGDIDELLDEIDDVLETNAEDFVRSYVQKGGQ